MNPSTPVVHIEKRGEGKPLVLLHAFPLSKNLYDDVQPPPGWCLLLPDFPGFGNSPQGPSGMTLTEAAQGLWAGLEPLTKGKPIVIGGVSMGGYWAMEFIRQFPSQVSGAVFIATRTGADDEIGRQKRFAVADKIDREGTGFLVQVMIPNLLGATTLQDNPDLVKRVQETILTAPPKAVSAAQRSMAVRFNQASTVRTMKVPGLWLAGAEDKFVNSQEAASNAALNPRIHLKVLDKVGHLIPWEAPDAFQRHLDNFLATL